MSIDDLAKYLKISRSTLYKLAQEDKLPGEKVGEGRRLHNGAVNGWLGNRRFRERKRAGSNR